MGLISTRSTSNRCGYFIFIMHWRLKHHKSHNFISLGTGLNLTDINEEVSHSVEGGESASEEDLNGDDWVENILWTLSVR